MCEIADESKVDIHFPDKVAFKYAKNCANQCGRFKDVARQMQWPCFGATLYAIIAFELENEDKNYVAPCSLRASLFKCTANNTWHAVYRCKIHKFFNNGS